MGTLVETDIDHFIRERKNKLQQEKNNLAVCTHRNSQKLKYQKSLLLLSWKWPFFVLQYSNTSKSCIWSRK